MISCVYVYLFLLGLVAHGEGEERAEQRHQELLEGRRLGTTLLYPTHIPNPNPYP